ncbi:MAG: preprotein translocase subunit SecE [Clostridiales bacterium]|nr:preprotein translocase subunit SecE [Clostridiales bacterium]
MADEKKIARKPKKERKFRPGRYLKEMWGEVKKLSWLSVPDLVKHTIAVIVFVLLMSALVFGFDQAFGAGVKALGSISAGVETGETVPHDHDGDGIPDHGDEDHEDSPAP